MDLRAERRVSARLSRSRSVVLGSKHVSIAVFDEHENLRSTRMHCWINLEKCISRYYETISRSADYYYTLNLGWKQLEKIPRVLDVGEWCA